MLTTYHVKAQSYTAQAYDCWKSQDFECAQTYIDSAIVSNERFDSQTWQLRGLIYRKLESPENADYRSISIESFVQARNLDTANVYKEKIDGYLYNTIIRYYNDAVNLMGEQKLVESENSYLLYKGQYKKYIQKDYDFGESDIQYYNALGSEYLKNLGSLEGEERKQKSAKAIQCFETTLSIDSLNYQATFNIGIIYYNEGADLLMNLDPFNTDIEQLNLQQENAMILFEKALPYLHKAYKLNPNSKEVVEGLAGSYYGLNDDENYNRWKELLDKMQE